MDWNQDPTIERTRPHLRWGPDIGALVNTQLWPTLRLAAPIMLARAGITLMFVVDSIMLGQADGDALAYFGQALAPQSIMMLVSIGLLQGSTILSAQAYGAKDFEECGRVWKTALMVAFVLGLAMTLLSLGVGWFLLQTGTPPELAKPAGNVSVQFAWGMQGMLLYIASNYFLETTKRPLYGMLIMGACNLLNLAADGVLVGGWFGWAYGSAAETAVMTTSAVRWLALVLALSAILALGDGRKFGVFAPLGPIWGRLKKMLRLGAPISLLLGVDQAAFSAVSILSGHMGVKSAAAQLLTQNLTGIVFMSIVGLAAATNIRVGHAVGADDSAEAAQAGWAGIGLGLAITLTIGLLLIAMPLTFAGIYTTDPAVLEIAHGTVMAGALMLIFDATVTVTNGALRGRGDTMTPALIHALALWVLGVPMAAFVGFSLGWGAPGLTLGLSFGMMVSCGLVLARFASQSRRPVRRA